MQVGGFIEKRRYIRFDIAAKVKFQVSAENKNETPSQMVTAISKNLSVEGIRFTSEKKLETGTMLKLEINLPLQLKPLEIEGQVKWCQSLMQPDGKEYFETGVKLFTIEKCDETRFVGYVNNLMKQSLGKYKST